ncbi:alpha-(1,3)-fucosyltransferase 10 [Toxorhynchites rutilus septentrionalis]|uniref:alpha-(1,3)-fucosyltransferase 10 n=1 Tax=Toxorhynchites rutilus septentrionalis TaxID=329112 RepID=UPI00247881C4|nr:alpha-(1,3)-fucosyltransferase 10 [Toxorhynchites rutilus septentrionalis]
MLLRKYRSSKTLLLSFTIVFVLSLYFHYRHNQPIRSEYNVLIWWSPYKNYIDYHRKCENIECRFTSDRKAKRDPFFVGYLFYGSNISVRDLPSRRITQEYWGLYHDASPKSVPFLFESIKLFNFTSTFSRHSDLPLTLQTFTSLEELINFKRMYSFGEKTAFQRKLKLSPILYIQSRCDTLTGRELYIRELGKYIGIDSYGSCLHNKTYPIGVKDDSKVASEIRDFYDLVSKYKFIIVYQDIVCEDYITEKFWKSLTLGVVPIYFGATNIKNYFPNPNSAILVDEYPSPVELAQFVLSISNSEENYSSFLFHKIADFYPITNQLLLDSIVKDDALYARNRKARAIAEFECYVCTQSFNGRKQISKKQEFSCNIPHFPPGNVTYKAEPRVSSFLVRSELQAALVHKLLNLV